jgi:hypothetical protein
MIVSQKLLAATACFALMVSAGAAHAGVVFSSFTEETFTVSSPGNNNAFCSGNTCDFKGGNGGNGAGSVNAPTLSGTSSATGLPVVATGSPTIIGQTGAHVLEWWSPGTFGSTHVTAGTTTGLSNPSITTSGSPLLFSNTSFFPPGGNDHSSFLTAEFTGSVTVGAGDTLKFTGSVDDNILIYVRTGTSGAYTLLPVSPTELSNQPSFNFASNALLAGTYQFEIFYADRSSTDASLVLDATVTAPVPEPSTWAMMILGFFGVGFLAYRKKTAVRFA